ncbi:MULTISPECIES: lycopene cyclase domain-containing protein [unclassified Corynebacterium]|uniref:lycopene cyclase domain-containing protein n=1 Tax=unclassified Corynebacterium TaxID=2624378 RepID=UPI002A918C6D|nr:lycopene cyclase domain-containing protein [Corynebacterium sp.]MDY5786442.1 lycopene cyclase domain-containing protein [Corynebacterium sp.]
MTYVLISAPFLVAAAVLWGWRRQAGPRQGRVTLAVMAVLVALTVIFDNLMVAAGLVEYSAGNNLGVFIGRIPVEDLFYTIFVVLVVTAVWPEGEQ